MGAPSQRRVLLDDEWWTVVHRADSPHGPIQVVELREDNGLLRRRCLHGGLVQNTYAPQRRQSLSHFAGALLGLARAYTPRIEQALCIGLGAGIVPRELAKLGVAVEVVEINPVMAAVATAYFDFDPGAVSMAFGDGREFVAASSQQYDAVLLDAFMDGDIPPHLVTVEALAEVKRHLRPDGVLVINAFGETSAARRESAAQLDRTLRRVFASTAVRQHGAGFGNVFFVATPRPLLQSFREPDFSGEHPELQFELMLMWQGVRPAISKAGSVYTDAGLRR